MIDRGFDTKTEWLRELISLLIPMNNFTKSVVKILDLEESTSHCYGRSAVSLDSTDLMGKICGNQAFSDRYSHICARKCTAFL